MSKFAFAVLCCTACIGVSARSQDSKPENSLTTNPVYQKNCAKCHGKTAQGHRFGGPSLVAAKTASISPEELRNTVANGKGHVPKFRMSEFGSKLRSEEINALVEQIQTLNRK